MQYYRLFLIQRLTLWLKFVLLVLGCSSHPVFAEQYQSKDAFITEVFAGAPPEAKMFWIKKELKSPVSSILQHKPGFFRTRYWQQDNKTVWILEEIGKVKPITVGIVIVSDKIEKVKVLAFRESRGWEVKHPFFTDQFKQISLTDKLNLNKSIDGISGATLSVRALNKVARLALFFNQQLANTAH